MNPDAWPNPAPYFRWPQPQPPAVRSPSLPQIIAPAPSRATRYKAAVAPAATPAGFAAAQVRNGSGTKALA